MLPLTTIRFFQVLRSESPLNFCFFILTFYCFLVTILDNFLQICSHYSLLSTFRSVGTYILIPLHSRPCGFILLDGNIWWLIWNHCCPFCLHSQETSWVGFTTTSTSFLEAPELDCPFFAAQSLIDASLKLNKTSPACCKYCRKKLRPRFFHCIPDGHAKKMFIAAWDHYFWVLSLIIFFYTRLLLSLNFSRIHNYSVIPRSHRMTFWLYLFA